MSQKAPERSNVKSTPAPEQKKQELPVAGSPNDPIGVTSGGTTSKPGERQR